MTSPKTEIGPSFRTRLAFDRHRTALRAYEISTDRVQFIPNGSLGRSGHADVVLATLDASSRTSTEVAVKIIRPEYDTAKRDRIAGRFLREVIVWASLDHPNVLKLIGFHIGADNDPLWLISPYCNGGAIGRYLAKRKPPMDEKLRLALEVALGLDYLHTRAPPICHGDLKPDNILVSKTNRAMICDFGVSRMLRDVDSEPSGLTTTSVPPMTMLYLAPELAMDDAANRTLASDVWAWGCVLYEILTGQRPYSSHHGSLVQLFTAMSNMEFPGILELLPSDLQYLLRDIWSWNAGHRPTMKTSVVKLQNIVTFGFKKLLVAVHTSNKDGKVVKSRVLDATNLNVSGIIEAAFERAKMDPSAALSQGWRIVLVDDSLRELHWRQQLDIHLQTLSERSGPQTMHVKLEKVPIQNAVPGPSSNSRSEPWSVPPQWYDPQRSINYATPPTVFFPVSRGVAGTELGRVHEAEGDMDATIGWPSTRRSGKYF